MTRKGRKRVDPCINPYNLDGGESASLLSVLVNNIQIFGGDTDFAAPTFIARTLVLRGWIAFDRTTGNWFAFNAVGPHDREGMPRRVRLILDGRGRMSPVLDVDDQLAIFPATPMFNVPAHDVVKRVDTLAFVQNAVAQNVDALRQIAAVVYNDEALTASLDQAEADRAAGRATTKIYTRMGTEIKLLNFSPDAKSNIPDLMSVYMQTIQELDAATGRATVGEKQERRITDEIAVIENAASSTIDVVIDTFNRFAKWYNVDAMAARGSALHRINAPSEANNPLAAGHTAGGATTAQGGANETEEAEANE